MANDFFEENNITHIDYKAAKILKKFINPYGRILNRRQTGLTAKNQRKLSNAIKRARFMAFLPFVDR